MQCPSNTTPVVNETRAAAFSSLAASQLNRETGKLVYDLYEVQVSV